MQPVSDETLQKAQEGIRLVVDAGAIAVRVAKVDESRLGLTYFPLLVE